MVDVALEGGADTIVDDRFHLSQAVTAEVPARLLAINAIAAAAMATAYGLA